jgi:hypothetical protein
MCSGLVWSGLVWSGLVWCGVVWCGVVRCGVLLSVDFCLAPPSALVSPQVMKKLRKLPWAAYEPYLLKCLLKVRRPPHPHPSFQQLHSHSRSHTLKHILVVLPQVAVLSC